MMTLRLGNSHAVPARWSWALAVWITIFMARASSAAEPSVGFERDVVPILLNRCVECHNATDKTGGLDLTSRESLLKGGESGEVVTPGKPDLSLLIEKILAGEMPPKKQGKARPLPPAEAARLRTWVAEGATWPDGRRLDRFEATTETRAGRDWWSLLPVKTPTVPVVKASGRVANPIDAFIVARLENKGWEQAPGADRRTLIRRVYDDLLGLTPSFEEIEAFAEDGSPDAYERLVESLLASPHYGERWGRFWLDVARYAETCGYERDQTKPKAWKYRDWVMRAFNDDMPFDRFVLEQLAGDELPDASEKTAVATGFIQLGTWNDEPNDPEEYKYERLEDMVHATSTAFLAVTVKCARCHDHKFDPIRQTDYYRMAAAFWAGPIEPGPRELLGGPDATALGHDVFGWTDRGREPPPLHLLKKGDPKRPGPVVEPGQLSIVTALDRPIAPPPPGSKTSHRRLQMARWVADPRNPLTARVWVNRLWQHHFGQALVRTPDNFGFTGEKPTHPELLDWLASELVEGGWTAKRLHRLILTSRTYRQSSVHPRQEEYAGDDAGDRLWWRAGRRRRDAEALRDALLQAGGRLDASRVGGPSFLPEIAADALEGLSMKGNAWKASPPDDQRRRSVYIFAKRGLLLPLMTTFDFMDTTSPCAQRDVTLVPPQALALMNNGFVHDQSEALARKALTGPGDRDGHIRRAWRIALGREPRASEIALAREHLVQQEAHFSGRSGVETRPEGLAREATFRAAASLCHVLLNSNEFLYVD